MLVSTLRNLLRSTGFDVIKINKSMRCKPRLQNMQRIGFSPKVIFDCGAYVGNWTADTSEIFPQAQFFLFEPNPEVRPKIESNLSGKGVNFKLFPYAIGEAERKATFNLWGKSDIELQSASLLGHVKGEASRTYEVDVKPLDSLVAELGVMPDLVKLDLQGAEKLALSGASKCLAQSEVFLIEFGTLEAYQGRTTPGELFEIMYRNDYVLYDILDCHYRPYDQALGGGDFIFVKKQSPLRKYQGYV